MIRIARVEAFAMAIDVVRARKISKGVLPSGEGSYPVLVRLESTDGAVGYGNLRPPIPWLGETTESIMAAIRNYYGPALVGQDASERRRIASLLERLLPGNSVARSIIDMALHDLVATTLGVPVYTLLGGYAQEIPLNWSITLNPREMMVDEAVMAVEQYGVTMICIKSGGPGEWAEDVETFRTVRNAVGDGVHIGFDPNEGYDVSTTMQVVETLRAERIHYLEQPLPRRDSRGLAVLRSAIGVPIVVDEGAVTIEATQRLIELGACDGVVLKLWKSGGFLEALDSAKVAESAGLSTTLGGVSPGNIIGSAAGAHLYASTGKPPMGAEFVLGLNVIEQDPIAALPAELRPRNGVSATPQGAGLGVEVDMKAVKSLAVATTVVE